MKTRLIYVALIGLLVAGCDRTDGQINVGKLRHSLYVECMELAVKMPRKADDDVSDIVYECSNQSWYMANQMSK